MTRVLALLSLLALPLAAAVETAPAQPQAGVPFEIVVSGVWGDSCGPLFERSLIANNTIWLTFGLRGGGCLSAVTPFSEVVEMPGLAAGPWTVRARLHAWNGPNEFFEHTFDVAGAPSGITSITQSFDTSAGNRVVVIRGSFPCGGGDCGALDVMFGSRRAEAVERISETEIHAVVPAQTNVRVVDVTVSGPGFSHIRPGGFTYVSLGEYERILIPVITKSPVPGAHGSLWQSELRMVTQAMVPLVPGIDVFPLDPRSGPVSPIPSRTMIEPRFAMPHPDSDVPPVQMVYLDATLSRSVSFNLRIRDLSRQAESWGTEIPVVRERDLSTRVTLVDVPMQPRFRQLLRIYMPDYVGCCLARVRFHSAEGPLLLERYVNLDRPNGSLGGLVPNPYLREGSRELPLQPGYGEIALSGIPELSGHESLWITVESGYAPSRVWAFVSITNDETQQVTTVTPQG